MTAHDLFQEVVGEIGINRREYLYELAHDEITLIRRGYRRRNVLQYQLQRLQAYGAMFAMSGTNKTPVEFLPMYFDKYITIQPDPISEQEKAELQREIDAVLSEQEKDSQKTI